MEIEIYQVDAFCKELFSGNPAAVCLIESWPDDALMQNIAAENNLAETAFCVNTSPEGGSQREGTKFGEGAHYHIRWFTPSVEVDLCGHATLATAHVLFKHKGFGGDTIVFSSRSGELRVTKDKNLLTLDFPVDDWRKIEVTDDMHHWFSVRPIEAYRGKTDYLLIFSSEFDVKATVPNFPVLEKLKEVRGVILSAKGNSVDFVSRFFAPQSGIPEDPVTGSAHTTLTPYWSQKLGKKELEAIQLSARKGFLHCKDEGNRIKISGQARTFLAGRLFV